MLKSLLSHPHIFGDNEIAFFGENPDLPSINYENKLDLSRLKDCVLIEHNNNKTGVNFLITSTKRYVPVGTFSANDDVNFLENIKQGFERAISCNKYRSEIIIQII